MRNALVEELLQIAPINEKIILLVGDLGFSVVEPFKKQFPSRFLNVGVAEQNMIGVAAGLAMVGFRPIVYSIANFSTLRCIEQIRNDVAYHELPVVIVSVGAGVSYGSLGYSHHAVQDIACMRSIPGMLMCTPADPMEVRSVLRYLLQSGGPAYLRLGKGGDRHFHDHAVPLTPNVPVEIRKGSRIAILGCGGIIEEALEAAEAFDASIFSMPLWSDSDEARRSIAALVSNFDKVFTLEEHYLSGGFGSFVRESLQDSHLQCRVRCLALDTLTLTCTGTARALRNLGGVGTAQITAAIKAAMKHSARVSFGENQSSS